jgi:hypothetical protein
MATKDAISTLTLEQDEVGKGTKETITEHDLAHFEVRT